MLIADPFSAFNAEQKIKRIVQVAKLPLEPKAKEKYHLFRKIQKQLEKVSVLLIPSILLLNAAEDSAMVFTVYVLVNEHKIVVKKKACESACMSLKRHLTRHFHILWQHRLL